MRGQRERVEEIVQGLEREVGEAWRAAVEGGSEDGGDDERDWDCEMEDEDEDEDVDVDMDMDEE